MDKANKTIDTINAKYEYAGDLFINGKYVPLLNSNSETSLADLAKLNGVGKNHRGRTDVAFKVNGEYKCPYSRIIIRRRVK